MKEIKRFQIRGVPGWVTRVIIEDRTVDYWAPNSKTKHLLVAHDGQNVFDGHTATHKNKTWAMAQSAIRVSEDLGITPPLIIAVFHSGTKKEPWGRTLDLSPQDIFQSGIAVTPSTKVEIPLEKLNGNAYLDLIADQIIPAISAEINFQVNPVNTAMIGSSMGGLATLNGVARRPDLYQTALAFSPHWTIGGIPLVESLINALPKPGKHKIWMSRGTKGLDREYKPFQDLADELMLKNGYHLHRDFDSKVYERTGHNEKAWAKYLPTALKLWLSE